MVSAPAEMLASLTEQYTESAGVNTPVVAHVAAEMSSRFAIPSHFCATPPEPKRATFGTV